MKSFSIKVGGLILTGLLLQQAAAEITEISATESEIRINLSDRVSGSVRLLELLPYDQLNPLRDLVEDRPDCQTLSLEQEGFLRMAFLNGSPFDPQIRFPINPVAADYVHHFSMRIRINDAEHNDPMPVGIYAYSGTGTGRFELEVPSDGQWHIVRADLRLMQTAHGTFDWSGSRTLRIDPANHQGYHQNADTTVDIAWFAVTYRPDFIGGRDYTGMDLFVDLGFPKSSWNGTATPIVVLPRYDGLRDRLFSKYILTDDTGFQVGSARYVTDLSGLSYAKDTTQSWSGLGGLTTTVSNGVFIAQYDPSVSNWDPRIYNNAQPVNVDAARELAFKYRIRNFRGSCETIPCRFFGFITGETGNARVDDALIPDGNWHIFRTTLDHSDGLLPWAGNMRFRIDAPDGSTGPISEYDGAVLEVDWLAISDNPLFTPAVPLCDGGRLWTFTEDRTFPLAKPVGIKGLNGPIAADIVELGCRARKWDNLQSSSADLSLNPGTIWSVDEFEIGIRNSFINNAGSTMKFFTDQGVVTYVVFLNAIQDYWLDQGTASQRFNPLRNRLTVANPPNSFSVAHNVIDPVGLAWYRGTLEALATAFSHPSGDRGQLYGYIIGNELDAHWSWYNIGEADLETVVDLYYTACRMADLAVRKIHPDARIFLSFTHYWNKAHNNDSLRYVKPVEFLGLFAEKARAEGDFPWGLCIHPYPQSLRQQQFWNDTKAEDHFNTEYITFKNLQVIRRYMQQHQMLYRGQPRPIVLGEQGFHVPTDGNPTDEAVQAAALAYSLKITEQIPDIEAYLYHRQLDHSQEGNLRFGLGTDDPDQEGWQYLRKRPSWSVMRDYSTENEAETLDPYLAYLPINDWSDINPKDIRLVYHFDKPNPNWILTQMTGGLVDGRFSGTTTGMDPQITHPHVDTFGDGQETALFRIKTARTGNWQFFWKTPGQNFTASRSAVFPVTASDDFKIYKLDLSERADWCGENIIAWRLDPADPVNAETPYRFEIDYMIFGPVGDFDGDGISDDLEGMEDLNGSGLPNMADLDSNGNGISDERSVRLGLNPHSLDSVGDGIPDAWNIQYGYNPLDPYDAEMDLDRDGYTTWEEYVAGTDPNDPDCFFRIVGVTPFGNALNVLVSAQPDRNYFLLRSATLGNPIWEIIHGPKQISQPGPMEMPDSAPEAGAFYRVQVTP